MIREVKLEQQMGVTPSTNFDETPLFDDTNMSGRIIGGREFVI